MLELKKKTLLCKQFAGNISAELYISKPLIGDHELLVIFHQRKDSYKWEEYFTVKFVDSIAIRDLLRKVQDFIRE